MKTFKTMYKNGKKTKLDNTEIEEYKFYEHKSPILINNIDFNKIAVSRKLPFSKQDFKYFISYKDAKKLDLCLYSIQK